MEEHFLQWFLGKNSTYAKIIQQQGFLILSEVIDSLEYLVQAM